VVGVGAHACDELARAAGIVCENGIVVDHTGRTSDPHIFALGDVTWRPMPFYGNRMFRLESVPNALEQAKQVASVITGRPAPPAEVPWFWSDQYDLKLQIAGVPFDRDEIVLRGDPAAAKFAVFHLRGGRVLAVEAVNSVAEFMVGKQLIAAGKTIDPAQLRDASIPMRQLAA
jgi:3-phenylpropionate/trans-cinnamate dioxygenase ferredoxin reductase subunit